MTDDIGLSERLQLIANVGHGFIFEGRVYNGKEAEVCGQAATQLDAQQQEIGHLACTIHELQLERNALTARVKELETNQERLWCRACQERNTLSRVMEDTARELGCASDNEAILEAIARLKQERDEALQRLKPFANGSIDVSGTAVIVGYPDAEHALKAASDLVRRLAAGPEKGER